MEKERRLLEKLFEAFNRHDADGVMACFASEAVFFTAAGPTPEGKRVEGHDAIRAAFASVWGAMPDVRWTVRRISLHDGGGVAEWLFSGTPASGKRIEVEGVDLFTFRDGLVATKNAFRKERTAG